LTNTSGGAVTVRLTPGLSIVNTGPNITVDQSVDGAGTITNIVSGSRIQIYNVTTSTQLANAIVSGTSYIYNYTVGTQVSSGDTIRVRLTYQNGITAKKRFETSTIAGGSSFSVLAQQTDDEVYNLIGLNGSLITEFTADYPNVEVNVSDPDNSTSVDRLYAWWVANELSADGIEKFFGGIEAEDAANFKIVTARASILIDNTSSTGVTFVGDIRLYRDDGATPLVAATSGGGSITLYAGKVYTVETGTSGLTPSEAAKLMSLPSDALTTPSFLALK
jgi:head-tail adaptor